MPAHAKGPISHAILGANGKPEKFLTFKRGDHVTDEQLELLGGHHARNLTKIAHNDHTCPLACAHESHSGRSASAATQASGASDASDAPPIAPTKPVDDQPTRSSDDDADHDEVHQ